MRLLLTGPRTDHPSVRYAGHRYYPRLLRAGVRIYEYQPCFLHLKMVLIDDWVSIGSCNFDHWNLRFNLEANIEALDPPLTAAVQASFERDFALSEVVDLGHWNARPLWRRVKQRLWGGWTGWWSTCSTVATETSYRAVIGSRQSKEWVR